MLNQSWLNSIIKVILYFIFAWITYKLSEKVVRGSLEKIVKAKYKEDKEIAEKREATLFNVIINLIKWTIGIIVVLMALSEFKVNITPLLTGAGVLGLAISFASRELIQDYLSGFFFLIEDQFRVGDEVIFGPPVNKEGKIVKFDLRKTIIEDKEGATIIVRNSKISFIVNKSYKK